MVDAHLHLGLVDFPSNCDRLRKVTDGLGDRSEDENVEIEKFGTRPLFFLLLQTL
ncbi:hypothetical protein HS1genome_1410 [Sulfodiicoccus acidiphilus]|uniref:Uncharacterized protein n=1 Tax=Sulfodiicoccus acidiphilus TaxID=1670455 RepID=A0A348B4B9_9CREN|nr:hypothetical protein HS1genome_1410 [Sulfodiicoccus acidiphilus]